MCCEVQLSRDLIPQYTSIRQPAIVGAMLWIVAYVVLACGGARGSEVNEMVWPVGVKGTIPNDEGDF